MPCAAVVDRDRTRRTDQVIRFRHVDRRRIFVAQTPGPIPRRVILIVERPVVTARHNRERTVRHAGIREIAADREDVVVGVGEELDVLMPLDRVARVEPLEVQFGVVKDDIGAREIGGDIRNQPRRKAPIGVVLFVGALQAPQNRSLP